MSRDVDENILNADSNWIAGALWTVKQIKKGFPVTHIEDILKRARSKIATERDIHNTKEIAHGD